MSSLITNSEYDNFISYRHNDNWSGWVTEFVNALQEELTATIKKPLTIYFDKNPHDGLLETTTLTKAWKGSKRASSLFSSFRRPIATQSLSLGQGRIRNSL